MNNPIIATATLVGGIILLYIVINAVRSLKKSPSDFMKSHVASFFFLGPTTLCLILEHTIDIKALVEKEKGIFDPLTGFSTIYSPAYKFSYTESFLGLYLTSIFAFIGLAGFVIPLLYIKLEKAFNRPLLSKWLSIFALIVSTIVIIVNIPIQYSKNKDKVFNYENYYNFEKIEMIEGTLLTIHELQLTWPGSLLTQTKKETGSLWTITNIKIDKNTLRFIDLDWLRGKEFGMPECFVDDFTELFTPYIGKEIAIRYYKTVTNEHPTDKEICLVEVKVKAVI